MPDAACLFSCWIAWTTSAGEIRWLAIRSGSSQTRMAYLRPNGFTSLTPGMRFSASTTLICAKLSRKVASYRPSGEMRLTTQTMLVEVFLTVTPYCLTSGGRLVWAVDTLFWMSTAAMSWS